MPSPTQSAADALIRADTRIEKSMKPVSDSALVGILAKVSEVGDQPQMRALCGAMILGGIATRNGRWARAGVRMLVAHEVATAAKNLIKKRVDRTRPRSAQSTEDRKPKRGKRSAKEETSFPSGHSAGATAAALAYAREYPEHRTAALAGAAAVAVAQVPRCAHYVTDVGAGMAIGAACGAATNVALDALLGALGTEELAKAASSVRVEELLWNEVPLGEIDFPRERLKLSAGFGSGLATREGDPYGRVWAICDRGPNIKLSDARTRYGWTPPREFADRKGAKLMPRADVGPALALLQIEGREVRLERTLRLRTPDGSPMTGLPIPESGHAECEPVLDLDGRHVPPDPTGMDTEGLAILSDGTFWASEEYGPSLIRLSADGEVLARLVPEGVRLPNAGYTVQASLPAIAAKRHLNRGFEAVSASPSGERVFVAFQSPLAHPTEEHHARARHVRLWQLDASGSVVGQYLYPLDEPRSFRRDSERADVKPGDLKVCEIVAIGENALLVLERASETSKIYRVALDDSLRLPAEHLRLETRPTIEELSCDGAPLPELRKQLLFTSDDWPVVCADIEGMALLDNRTLLIVSDNDFGCEGKQTRFYRLTFEQALI